MTTSPLHEQPPHPALILLFNHRLTARQEDDARNSLGIDRITNPPISIRTIWAQALSAGLPSMILQNGFGQTLAFLLSKGKDKHLAAFEIIALWLVNRKFISPSNQQLDILNQISKMNQAQYLQAQRETLAMLEWLKRYANAALFEG